MMILRLALQKIRAMAGGYGFSAAVLAAAFALFFIIAATLGTTRTQLLRIALTDEDDSPLSHEFAELLNDSDGEFTGGKTRFVSVRFGTREESEEAVRSGKAEGALIILKGFGAGLESGEEAFLEYRASADASSAPGGGGNYRRACSCAPEQAALRRLCEKAAEQGLDGKRAFRA